MPGREEYRGDRAFHDGAPREPEKERARRLPRIEVVEHWLEQVIGDWRVAYRVGLSQATDTATPEVVISEIRVFPAVEQDGEERLPGEWNGSWNGAAQAVGVPTGGITAALLRAIPVRAAGATARLQRSISHLFHGLDAWDVPQPRRRTRRPSPGRPGTFSAKQQAWIYRRVEELRRAGEHAYAERIAVELKLVGPSASPEERGRAASLIRQVYRRSKGRARSA
ncbi:hypothetical protein TBR22_A31970 [Luteitalea sp. TBR-22]|nr:hypothetical protein TBR22_A31970 [Luteitalea sp. TBR-22]